MKPEEILREYYEPGSRVSDLLIRHSEQVAAKGLEIADHLSRLNPDRTFIVEAAMLHDIGICMTHAPSIHCHGEHPYICHGYLGRLLLDDLGYPRHALVAERHTGAGITLENIMQNRLPLPRREMVPRSLEEKIVCVADKFFSKSPSKSNQVMDFDSISRELASIDKDHARRLEAWIDGWSLPG